MRLSYIIALLLSMLITLSACSGNKTPSVQTPSQSPPEPAQGQDQPPPNSQPAQGEKLSLDGNASPKSQAGSSKEKSPGSGEKLLITPEKGSSLPAAPPGMAFATGEKIPSFRLPDLEGTVHSQSIFAGPRLTVLNFWGTY